MRYNIIEVSKISKSYESLLLKNQLCFPLYAVSNMIIRKYKPYLDDLNLTYTQYIVMMVLWEKEVVNESLLCESVCLKSNTITPLLKKLEEKGYIRKEKNTSDERNLIISLTDDGKKLRDKAVNVPACIAKEINLTSDEAIQIYKLLYKMLDEDKERKDE